MNKPNDVDGCFDASNCSSSPDRGAQFLGNHLQRLGVDAKCICHRCIEENNICLPGMPGWKLNMNVMILCAVCGNKRCPHASDHRLTCTGSNEPGQPGSVY